MEYFCLTVQSLKDKKIAPHLQQWALDPEGWHVSGQDTTVTLFTEEADKVRDKVLYKERWINENNLEQRLIVTYSQKYAVYQRTLRQQQIDRALKAIRTGTARRKKKSPNDASRLIAETHYNGSAINHFRIIPSPQNKNEPDHSNCGIWEFLLCGCQEKYRFQDGY